LAHAPGWLFAREIASKAVRSVLRDYEPTPLSISAVHPAGRRLPTKVRVLIDFLAQIFAQQPTLAIKYNLSGAPEPPGAAWLMPRAGCGCRWRWYSWVMAFPLAIRSRPPGDLAGWVACFWRIVGGVTGPAATDSPLALLLVSALALWVPRRGCCWFRH